MGWVQRVSFFRRALPVGAGIGIRIVGLRMAVPDRTIIPDLFVPHALDGLIFPVGLVLGGIRARSLVNMASPVWMALPSGRIGLAILSPLTLIAFVASIIRWWFSILA